MSVFARVSVFAGVIIVAIRAIGIVRVAVGVVARVVGSVTGAVGIGVVVIAGFRLSGILRVIVPGVRVVVVVGRAASRDAEDGAGERHRQEGRQSVDSHTTPPSRRVAPD